MSTNKVIPKKIELATQHVRDPSDEAGYVTEITNITPLGGSLQEKLPK
jgi:hypothetical protein